MFNRKPRIYIARAMTGMDQAELVKQAKEDKQFFEKCGIEVLCPVLREGVKPINKPLSAPKKKMDIFWPADKAMIRYADIFVNVSPHLPSLGVIREYGYARYSLWKKVISIFPEDKLPSAGSIARYEDDEVIDSKLMAVESILRTHGTVFKRLKWRFKLLNRCLLKWILFQLQEFK